MPVPTLQRSPGAGSGGCPYCRGMGCIPASIDPASTDLISSACGACGGTGSTVATKERPAPAGGSAGSVPPVRTTFGEP